LTGTMATAAWIIGIFAFLCMIVVVFYLWRSIF